MRLGYVVYLVALCALSWAAFKRPFPTTDTIGYAAVIASQTNHDPFEVVAPFMKGVESDMPERIAMLRADPYSLGAIEPFYSVRPLYNLTVQAAWKVMPLTTAFAAVSAASFFLIGLLIVAATREPLYSLPVLLIPTLTNISRFGTPDAMSTAFIVGAFLAGTKGRITLALGLLAISVWVRTDNLIILFAALAILFYAKRVVWWQAVTFAVIGWVSFWTINHFSGNTGWGVLIYVSIFRPLTVDPNHHLTFRELLYAYRHGLGGLVVSYLPFTGLLAALLWHVERWKVPIAIASLAIVARLAVYPFVEDRYFAWFYVIVGIGIAQLAAISCAERK